LQSAGVKSIDSARHLNIVERTLPCGIPASAIDKADAQKLTMSDAFRPEADINLDLVNQGYS
jgi:hypothetical protein